MPQIQKGETFADGQQVTGARLNQLIDSATILPNIITDQTNIATNGVASNDTTLIYDTSATALREANVSDILNSNLPVTTSSITAGNGSDVVISPQDGTIVTGCSFTSANGLTVVVTSNAHGLVAGQVITTTASTIAGYNGTHKITAVTTNTFTYVMTVAGTIGSGTISYTKQGAIRNTEHSVVSGNIYVDGNESITGNSIVTGNSTISGNLTVSGTATINLTTSSTAITQTNGDSTTKVATTQFVNNSINAILNPIKAWAVFNGTSAGTFAGGTSTVSKPTGSNAVATVTTTNPHGLVTGNAVYTSGISQIPAGNYIITSSGLNTFTFVVVSNTFAITAQTITFNFRSIGASFNINSIAYNGTGDYSINFTTPMQDTNFVFLRSIDFDGVTNGSYNNVSEVLSTSTATVRFTSAGGSGLADSVRIDTTFIR